MYVHLLRHAVKKSPSELPGCRPEKVTGFLDSSHPMHGLQRRNVTHRRPPVYSVRHCFMWLSLRVSPIIDFVQH